MNESGTFAFFSYRDPKIEQTYENFEKVVNMVMDKEFTEDQLEQAKLLAFQKIDRVVDPSLKGLIQFSRGYSDELK